MTSKDIFYDKMDALADSINTKANSSGQKNVDTLKSVVDNLEVGSGGGTMFPTVADMISEENLIDGMVVQTAGFYSAGDGGGAKYRIVSSGTADDIFVHELDNGLFAILIMESGFVNVKQVGAKGDGTTDDTSVIEAVTANGDCMTIYFPEGVYIVTPKTQDRNQSSSETTLKYGKVALQIDRDNVTICGDGMHKSILKLADNILDRYRTMVFIYAANNCSIYDIGIDQNPEESPLLPEPGSTVFEGDPPEGDGTDHNRNLYKLNCIATSSAIENLYISNCFFRHNGSQAIMANSITTNTIIENCQFSFAPSAMFNVTTPYDAEHPENGGLYYPRSSGPQFDNSTVYVRGDNAIVRGNRFFSETTLGAKDTYVKYNGSTPDTSSNNYENSATGQVLLRAATAIENHASGIIITENYVENYSTAVIMTQDTNGDSKSFISDNTFTDVCSGVSFWWKTEISGVLPVNPGVTIRGNRISQTVKWYNHSVKNPSAYAHAFQSATAGVLKNIDVSGNTVIFDRNSLTLDALTYGLASSAGFASAKAVEIDGLIISDNVFIDLPVYGVYLHTSSGSVNITNATIRNNVFMNCGWCDRLEAALATNALKNNITRRAAIEISPTTLADVEIYGNDIIDSSSGGECGEAILISNSAWVTSGALAISDNKIRSASGAGFSIGSVSIDNIDDIIDGTSQFNRYNVVEDEPTNLVVKVGQLFTNGVKAWKGTVSGSCGRTININSASMKVIARTTGSVYTTILTAATESHGLKVGDTINVTYSGTTKALTVLLVNGETIYTTDWASSEISTAVTVTIAINNKGVIEEQPLGTVYTAGHGISIENGVISVSEIAETFAIPGTIPVGVSAIGYYTVNGNTEVSQGAFSHADGSIVVGNQTINLPELTIYESLTAQANGTAVKSSYSSGEIALSTMTWNVNADASNTDSVYFYSNTDLNGANEHSDSVLAEDFICNALPSQRINTIMPNTYTQHGIGIGSSNRLRVRLTRQEMLDAGVSSADVETSAGFIQWCNAVSAKIIYEKTTETTSSTSVDPLTEHSGVVTLTGGYAGGTMTTVDQQTQIDDLLARVVALENAIIN